MQRFSEQLTEARKAKGMTQAELATAAEVSRQTVSSWETGRTRPDVEMARRLSELLGQDLVQSAEALPPEIPEDAPEAPAEAVEAPAPAADAPKPRRVKLMWLVAAVAVVICVGLAFFLRGRNQPTSVGNGFDAAYYRQLTANVPGKPYLVFKNTRWTDEGEAQSYDRYTFKVYEQNGVGFEITRVELVALGKSGAPHTLILGPSDLTAAQIEPSVAPYGDLSIDGGWPSGEFSVVGMELVGQAPDGDMMTFYSLIEF